jgi:hypothetical protein
MKKAFLFYTVFIIIVSSCVSKKNYSNLQSYNDDLQKELTAVKSENENLQKDKKNLEISTHFDLDGDGVDDSLDLCPNTFGLIENNGCPAIEIEEEEEEEEEIISESIIVTPEYSEAEINFYKEKYENLKTENSLQLQEISDSKFLIGSLENKQYYAEDKGYVAIDCPLIMKEGIQTNVDAILGKVIDSIVLNLRLLKLSNTENIDKSSNIRASRVVDLAKRMKIEILKNSNFEEIVLINGNEEKNIDLELGTRWKWHVTPKENIAGTPVSLSFRITAINDKGIKLLQKIKTIEIEVKIAKSYWQRLIDVSWEKPYLPITTFLLPFLTYFAGVWRENRKNKSKA